MNFSVNGRRAVPLISVLFGLCFAVLGVVSLCQPKTERLSATAAIVRIDGGQHGEEIDYTVYVDYEVNGQKYSAAYPAYSSSMKVGDEVEVLYDPADPADITAPGSAAVPWVFLGAGIGVLLLGVVLFLRNAA